MIKTLDELRKMKDPELFDFKCVNSELEDIKDGVQRFLKYRMTDCTDRDTLDLTADSFEKLYGVKRHAGSSNKNRYFLAGGAMLESDTMNSFWTTYRALLEFCVKEYCRKQMDIGIPRELLYEFIVVFGGVNPAIRSNIKLNRKKFREYSMENDLQAAYEYFSDYANHTGNRRYEETLHLYVTYCLQGGADTAGLTQERYVWLYANHSIIRKLIEAVCGENVYREVEKFARLTHAIGNYCLVPYGFNTKRASLTDDYWDLSLVTLQGYAYKGNWYGEGERWFAKHFSDVLKLDCYFDDVRKDLFCESEVRPLFPGHSFEKRKPGSVAEFEELLIRVNECIEERGRILLEKKERVKEVNKNEFDVGKFIKEVSVRKVDGEEKYEFEVTDMATNMYLKYPCYKNWEIMQGNDCKLLRQRDNYFELTADVLTSIQSPVETLLGKEKVSEKGINTGSVLREAILANEIEIDHEIKPYIQLFAYTYYWIGNMMPVVCNFNGGAKGADTWKYKIDKILQYFDLDDDDETLGQSEERINSFIKNKKFDHSMAYTKRWPGWLRLCWGKDKKDEFLKQNFLLDMIENGKTKAIVNSYPQVVRLSAINGDELRKNNYQLAKEWFLNNTKLIIQRSYYIDMEIEVATEEDKKNIQCIFGYLFEKFGIEKNVSTELF